MKPSYALSLCCLVLLFGAGACADEKPPNEVKQDGSTSTNGAASILPASSGSWDPHTVRLLNGNAPIQVPAQLQILTESWNRVVAVPYLVYMPDQDRLLMLVSCDYPHHAMVLTSADHGAHWTEPRPIHLDKDGKTTPGLGTSLTYLGDGKLLLATDRLWFSADHGATWGGPDGRPEAAPIPPTPTGKTWNLWDPMFVLREPGGVRLIQTGYAMDSEWYTGGKGPGYSTAFLRSSSDEGRTWAEAIAVPSWKGVSEVALLRTGNGNLVAACRTDIPAKFKGETFDHLEGLAVSISKDAGRTWSNLNRLYSWGRHHPSMVLLPNGDLVMTYVVRKGYTDSGDGFPQFGIEAIVSRDHGQSWDLDHRYILHVWPSNRKGPDAWWGGCQATSSVRLPDGSILTAFGTGYRSQPVPGGPGMGAGPYPSPRDVGLVLWRPSEAPLSADRTITDAPYDSDLRNVFTP